MNLQQILASGTIICETFFFYVLRTQSRPRSNTKSRLKRFEYYHRASLSAGPLAASLLDLLEGAVVTYWHLCVQQQQQHYAVDQSPMGRVYCHKLERLDIKGLGG